MMLGITRADVYLLLSQEEIELGQEAEGQNRLLIDLTDTLCAGTT